MNIGLFFRLKSNKLKWMKKFLIVLGVLVLAGVGLFYYLHGFDDVEIVEAEIPEMNLVYVKHVGSYYGVGAVMMDLHNKIVEEGIESSVGAGIYIDDPEITPSEELRSLVGDIVSDEDLAKLEGKDFQVLKIKNGKGVMSIFPYKNMLSYMLAPMKVYPAMVEYFAGTDVMPVASLEIYDVANKNVTIYMDLESSYAADAAAIFSE